MSNSKDQCLFKQAPSIPKPYSNKETINLKSACPVSININNNDSLNYNKNINQNLTFCKDKENEKAFENSYNGYNHRPIPLYGL